MKKKITEYYKRYSTSKILYIIVFIFAFLFISVWVLLKSKYNLHSDMATAPLLAREQLRTGEFFPTHWWHAQTVWIFEINVIILPILAITKQMLLSRELAVIVQTFLVCICMYKGVGKMVNRKSALFSAMLILVPLSLRIMDNLYYDATYNSINMFMCLILYLGISFYERKSKEKKIYIFYALFSLVVLYVNIPNIKYIAMVFAPFIIALVLYKAIKYKLIIKDMLKGKKEIIIVLTILLMSLIGIIIGSKLKGSVNYIVGSADLKFTDASEWGNKIAQFPISLFELYGANGSGNMMSITGIITVCKFCCALLFCVLIPIVLLKNYKKLNNNYQRIFVLYSLVALIIMFYLYITSNMISTTSRYLFGIYFNNIILAGIFFDNYINKSEYYSKVALILFTIPLFAGCYYSQLNADNSDYYSTSKVLEYLKQEDMHYGYASYWNAYKNTVRTNGDIEFVSYLGDINNPFKWLNSDEWYTFEYNDDKFFILLNQNEILDDIYYDKADRINKIDNYTILIYEHKRSSYNDFFVNLPSDIGIDFEYKATNLSCFSQNGIREDDYIVSNGKEGALLFGPYASAKKGTYKVVVDVEVVENEMTEYGWFDIYSNGHVMTEARIKKTEILNLEFELQNDTDSIEIRLFTNKDSIVKFKEAKITKIK